MKDTSLTIMAIIALLLSVVAIGCVFLNQPKEVDLSKLNFDISTNRISIDNLNEELGSYLDLELDCDCKIDREDLEDLEDELEDLEDNLDDDIDDVEDDLRQLLNCIGESANVSEINTCLE